MCAGDTAIDAITEFSVNTLLRLRVAFSPGNSLLVKTLHQREVIEITNNARQRAALAGCNHYNSAHAEFSACSGWWYKFCSPITYAISQAFAPPFYFYITHVAIGSINENQSLCTRFR
jgi:hypothetical protein